MHINFDRICKLAGVQNTTRTLNEASNRSHHEDPSLSDVTDFYYGNQLNEKSEGEKKEPGAGKKAHDDAKAELEKARKADEEEKAKEQNEGSYDEGMGHYDEGHGGHGAADDPMNEMVEVDIAVLMSEIRRAKKLMKIDNARKQNNDRRQRALQENHLKRIVAQEVQNILSEIDQIDEDESDSSWLYGKRKPKHSRKGYTNQGRLIPGLGFGHE
tara:strand:+ start:485 stop:1126 length:642 start_codon:yes stop_codon:yes gene_type:complete